MMMWSGRKTERREDCRGSAAAFLIKGPCAAQRVIWGETGMKGRILGITAEYDPFHRGHEYHLNRAVEEVHPEGVVAVMSGNFTQRGEPAVLDKWSRAEIAVEQGLDLVLELPFIYACNRAEHFASGAVDLLVRAGASHIAFGCEAEHPEKLEHLTRLRREHARTLAEETGRQMSGGNSRAKAGELASRRIFGDELTDLSLSPNNILALEYLRRMLFWEDRGQKIVPVPVLRHGAGYREKGKEGFAGGSAIRRMLQEGRSVEDYIPWNPGEACWLDYEKAHKRMFLILQGILLRGSAEDVSKIYGVGEGLENKLKKEIRRSSSWEDFLRAMTSRRYTSSAIRRILAYVLLGLSGGLADKWMGGSEDLPLPAPIRVLAASGAGRKLLKEMGDAGIVSRGAGANRLNWEEREIMSLDLKATDLYNVIRGRSPSEWSDLRRRPAMPERP